MGYDALVRKGVSIIDDQTKDLQVSVDHSAWVGSGIYAEPVYATAISRMAIVEFKQVMRRTVDGREILQKATVTFPRPIPSNGTAERREPIDPRDKIVLPNGYTGPILDVDGVIDPSTKSLYMAEVILG